MNDSAPATASGDGAGIEAQAELDVEGDVTSEAVPSETVDETTAGRTGSGEAGGSIGLVGAHGRVNLVHAAGYIGAALAGALLAGALFVALGGAGKPAASPSPAPSAEASGLIPATGSTLGRAGAPVTIEIWSDFQCPYCSLLAHAIEPDLVRGPVADGEVQLVYSDFVFLGQESLDAAVAARCAGLQGSFWRYHDLLFASQHGENQGTFSQQFLASLAGFAGLDGTEFQQCVGDPSIPAAVLAETKQGRAAGVESTPTLIIRGPVATRTLRGLPSWSSVTVEIDRATGRAPIPSPEPTAVPATPASSAEPTGTTTGPAPSAGSGLPATAAPGATTTP
jgi:protein-disulfide isomerase